MEVPNFLTLEAPYIGYVLVIFMKKVIFAFYTIPNKTKLVMLFSAFLHTRYLHFPAVSFGRKKVTRLASPYVTN